MACKGDSKTTVNFILSLSTESKSQIFAKSGPFKRFRPWIPLQITFPPGFRYRRPVSPLDSAAGDPFPLGFRCGCSCQLLELLLSTLFCPNIYAPGQNKVDTLPVSLSVLTLFSCNETEPRIRRHPYSPLETWWTATQNFSDTQIKLTLCASPARCRFYFLAMKRNQDYAVTPIPP